MHELKSPVAAVKAVAEALGEDGREGRLARALRDTSARLETLRAEPLTAGMLEQFDAEWRRRS